MSAWADEPVFLGDTPIHGSKISAPDTPPGFVGELDLGPGTPTSADRIKAARRFWPQLEADDLGNDDAGVLFDKGSGFIYEAVLFDPLSAADPAASDVELFTVRGHRLLFLRKPAGGPRRISDLTEAAAQAETDQARDEASSAEQRRKQLDQQRRRVVTLGDVEARDLPTLQQAAQIIVDEFRGKIEAKDGKLQISVPEMLTPTPGGWDAGMSEALERRRVADAVKVLIHARDLVISELDRRGRLDPDRLPDTQVTADGGIAT